jgi:hypothetical protein
MTPEEILQFDNLKREVENLKALFYKDNYSNLEVFRKKVEFKANIKIADIDAITKTGGTATIADGNHAVSIPVGGGTITIVTKNGLITNIT